MTRSAAEERAGTNLYLKWRSKRKDFLVAYSSGNRERAWQILRQMMLLVNRNFEQVTKEHRESED